jgi:hypothetical protein
MTPSSPDAIAASDGTWSLTYSGLPAGDHVLVVTQTDVAGNPSAPSAPIPVTLSSPSLTLERQGRWSWRVSFSGAPGATVQVLRDGEPRRTEVLDGRGHLTLPGLYDAPDDVDYTVRYVVDRRFGPAASAERTGWSDNAVDEAPESAPDAPASLAG